MGKDSNIGAMLIEARNRLNLSRSDLAKKLNIPYSSLASLENDNPSGKSNYLHQVAEELGLRVVPVEGGITLKECGHSDQEAHDNLPVFRLAEVVVYLNEERQIKLEKVPAHGRMMQSLYKGLQGFWVEMDSLAMVPRINRGETILIDTQRKWESGDIVLALCEENGRCIVRRYFKEADQELLAADNTAWPLPIIALGKGNAETDVKILGVAIDAVRKLSSTP